MRQRELVFFLWAKRRIDLHASKAICDGFDVDGDFAAL
jgi:hypothetical protein